MKRLTCCILILLNFSTSSFCQNIDTAIAKVFYTLKHQQKINNKDRFYNENMILLVGKKTSLFKSYERMIQSENVAKNIEEQIKNWTGPRAPRTILPNNLSAFSTQEVLQSPQNKTIKTSEYLWLNYCYEEPLVSINWKLLPERKQLNGIDCQKATAVYRGREWIVWFAPEIPLETGPWKLYGLPGLIIEAHDKNNEVQFLFAGLENLNNKQTDAVLVRLPLKVVSTTLNDINKLKEVMYKDPSGFTNTQMKMARGIIDPKEFAGFGYRKISNPIDLTEVK